MNPHLDELISLVKHPAIQGRRGYWRCYDKFMTKHSPDIKVVLDTVATRTGIELKAMENGILGNIGWGANDCVWLPPLSDPIQPERGLLGFLKGLLSIDYKGGNLGYYVWVIADDLMRHFDGPTPEIAVCKAIVAQSEEEK